MVNYYSICLTGLLCWRAVWGLQKRISLQPVLEYACPVWHSSLTAMQTKAPESLHYSALQSAAHHLRRRWLYQIADSSQVWHAGVKAQTTDRALLQAQCPSRSIVPALSAPRLAWCLHHRQTAPHKNYGTF